jgi:hypothetical protein
MPQLILTPDDAATGPFTVRGPLSRKEIELKKVIDLSVLLPGDLVLVSSMNPGIVARRIREIQQHGGYLPDDARWEHAAMYIGKGVILEATRSGVHRAMLSKYVGDHYIRVRRHPALTKEECYELVISALSLEDYSYSYWEVLRLWKRSKDGFGNAANAKQLPTRYSKRATICSQLYVDSYITVTNAVIGNADGGESTPAWLSVAATLDDVALNWLSIP